MPRQQEDEIIGKETLELDEVKYDVRHHIDRRIARCTHCQKLGHLNPQCPKFKAKEQTGKRQELNAGFTGTGEKRTTATLKTPLQWLNSRPDLSAV